MKINVLGLDPSLNNWGIVHATLDVQSNAIEIQSFELTETESQSGKTTRKNSDDIRRANELHTRLVGAIDQSKAVVAFCEVPVGSQSARAMASYGICVGVLGACPVPLIQLTPYEVKIAAVNCKTAAKEEMIEWATNKHPNAPWLRRGGKLLAKNEHLADATAAIYAGLKTAEFQTFVRMLQLSGAKSAEVAG